VKAQRTVTILGYYHGPKLGVGVYIDRLMTSLATGMQGDVQYVLYTNKSTLSNIRGELGEIEVVTPRMLGMGAIMAILWSAILFPVCSLLRRASVSLILTNPIVVFPLVRTVSVVHDLNEFEIDSKYGLFRTFYRRYIMLASAIANSSRVVVISEFVKKQVCRFFRKTDARHVDVVIHGIDTIDVPPSQAKRLLTRAQVAVQRYYLVVGRLDPRGKNLYAALDLFRWLERHHPGHELLFVGGINDSTRTDADTFLDHIREDDELSASVRYLGFVDDAMLSALYSGATATIFLSRVEGFGFPMIEAFKCGCPVLYNADCEVLREHAEGAAIPIDECRMTGLLPATIEKIYDPVQRADLVKQMTKIASEYDWSRCADGYLRVLEQAAG